MSGDIVPATRNWTASHTGPDEAGGRSLLIRGEIKLGNENEIPMLVPSEPPSSTPDVLRLDLQIVVKGDSSLRMHWSTVLGSHPVVGAGYTLVWVMWAGIEVAGITV